MAMRSAALVAAMFIASFQQPAGAQTCDELEESVDLAHRYADIYARHGSAHDSMDMRERAWRLEQRYSALGCGDLRAAQESREALLSLWNSSGVGAEWKYLGEADGVSLQYILAHRRREDVAVWLMYNYPGTIPDGKRIWRSGERFKSSAQLVRVSCLVALYTPIGTIWFGDGSAIGAVVGIQHPAEDNDETEAIPADSMLAGLRAAECDQ